MNWLRTKLRVWLGIEADAGAARETRRQFDEMVEGANKNFDAAINSSRAIAGNVQTLAQQQQVIVGGFQMLQRKTRAWEAGYPILGKITKRVEEHDKRVAAAHAKHIDANGKVGEVTADESPPLELVQDPPVVPDDRAN